ncbi:MAG: TrmJ/YjtD family RNA methyltransferase [Xanthomonadales bacterium]|nr:tRNA (cytidine/uridine-2'-O-)-methyltransferase TrmJ [Xanthomonadales bacterium]MCC6592983.1 TrmJ/YjtD family RNA methyltransferase [Xanthomonadales bacterium]MCE7932087.1 TrmJ/YjtD family RNA methyltransferase [Xanthomonadales bacterium PRO6]
MSLDLARVRIVLCDAAEPANIGAAARALRTMGLSDLRLVRPRAFPHASASRLAANAIEVLDSARVASRLEVAVAGCAAVFGVSARERRVPLRRLWPREAAQELLAVAGEVALVFGGEDAGLANADLDLCSVRVEIPSDPDCRSLNLAAAVQLLCWELRLAALDAARPPPRPLASPAQAEALLAALDAALDAAGWYANKNRALALEKLRRLLQRARPERGELQMLHGILARLGRDSGQPER